MPKNIVCKCGKIFGTKRSLASHKIHSCSLTESSRELYQCDFCPCEYRHQFSLNRHMSICPNRLINNNEDNTEDLMDSSTYNSEEDDNIEEKDNSQEDDIVDNPVETNIVLLPGMFQFAAKYSDIPNTRNGTSKLYLFLTHRKPNHTQGFIKFGLTTQPLKSRFSSYKPLDPTNIYWIEVQGSLQMRENLILNIFKAASTSNELNIWHHEKREYYKGDIDTMLKIYMFVARLNDMNLNGLSNHIDLKNIKRQININHTIHYYTQPRDHLMDRLVSDIRQVNITLEPSNNPIIIKLEEENKQLKQLLDKAKDKELEHINNNREYMNKIIELQNIIISLTIK